MAHILVVDDDDAFRLMLRKTLHRLGHSTVEARNGHAAWQELTTQNFDLIILDLIMPEAEGLETLRRLRKDHVATKVLAISGGGRVGTDDILKFAALLGADATLSKPFTQEQLSQSLTQLLPPSATA